jgi:uncharacterized DUF497 family protein
VTAFENDNAITIKDERPGERRFIALGIGEIGRILVGAYPYRGLRSRIIPAHKATAME